MGYEDIVAELKATKEIIVEAQNAITARKESLDSFSSNLKNILEKAKNNPGMFDNIPYENIQYLENSLEGLSRLNASGIIQAEEQIKDFEDFLALYKKRQTRKNLPYYLCSIYENCDNVIKELKRVYGDEIEKTLDYCAKATVHDKVRRLSSIPFW